MPGVEISQGRQDGNMILFYYGIVTVNERVLIEDDQCIREGAALVAKLYLYRYP